MTETPSQAVALRRTLIPAALQAFGVQVGQDPETGFAVVLIPPEVRQHCNVLDPVQSFAQADPNWSPSIRVVQLDASKDGPHFYSNKSWGQKVAPSKQALELLAKAGGVVYTRTGRIPRDELSEGERFGYKATLGIRRSDGTIEEITRDRVWNEEVEKAKIEDAVANATVWENGSNTGQPKFPPGPARDAECRKRWLAELEHAPAKTESKAVLRAIRAALQIPHQLSPQDAAKPFVVVGYSFTPDYDDVETKRLLVAAGLNAQAALYGSGSTRSADLELPAGPPAEGPEAPGLGTAEGPPVAATPATEPVDTTDAGGGQQAGETKPETPSGGIAADPVSPAPGTSDFDGEEPIPAAEPKSLAETVTFSSGRYEGKTIADVFALGAEGVSYLHWCLTNWKSEPIQSVLAAFAETHPEIAA